MGGQKIMDRKRRHQIWLVICSVAVVIVSVISIVATNRNYSSVLDNVMGGSRAILEKNDNSFFELDDGITTKADALAYGNKVNNLVCEEGFVLLKNSDNALPLNKGAKISVFGKNSVDIVMSGSGSAASSSDKKCYGIYDSLLGAGFVANNELKNFYENDLVSGSGRSSNPKIENSGNVVLSIGETAISEYTTVEKSFVNYSDAAIIVLSRIGGEGFDLPRTQAEDSTRHYLELDKNEEALIDMVTSGGFGKVIVLINSANPIELGFLRENNRIDAAIWIGNVGAQGIMALGKILAGEVNPSGRLTDTYSADFTLDPVWQNFGNNGTENGDRFMYNGKNVNYYFVDYEEGIYVGYRYYETRYAMQNENKDDWYYQNVIYPFGYGLSYSEFEWEIVDISASEILRDEQIKMTVKVTNVSTRAGKDVVEVFSEAPYTDGGIEKSSKVLVAFAKTELLAAGESQELVISVDPYAMASYDNTDANNNGFRGYELESGDYTLHVARSAHDTAFEVNLSLNEGCRWATDGYTLENIEITNRFDDATSHIETFMSRSNFEGSFPVSPTDSDKVLSENMRNMLKDVSSTANPILAEVSEVQMPVSGKSGELSLSDLSGKSFSDPLWEELLDMISLEEMVEMQLCSSFNTAAVSSIGKPKTTDADGPNGFTVFMGDPTIYETTTYCCEGIMAATFNVGLMRKLGNAIGNESLLGNEQGDGAPYTGWYAPAMNIHRSPFGGRNCEYFSEDPYLSGMMGAYEILGANDKGVISYVKHLVGNEQETHRATGGNCTFTNEQALRELYLKPFEYAVKIGKTKAIMSSFNRIGTVWTGGDYRLLTEVLRGEWGFHGAVITDFNTNPSYMNTRQMAYAGGTLDLASQPHDWVDTNNALDVYILRQNTHETLYAIANSNVMNYTVSGYKMAYWRIALIVVDAIVAISVIVSGVFVFELGKKRVV